MIVCTIIALCLLERLFGYYVPRRRQSACCRHKIRFACPPHRRCPRDVASHFVSLWLIHPSHRQISPQIKHHVVHRLDVPSYPPSHSYTHSAARVVGARLPSTSFGCRTAAPPSRASPTNVPTVRAANARTADRRAPSDPGQQTAHAEHVRCRGLPDDPETAETTLAQPAASAAAQLGTRACTRCALKTRRRSTAQQATMPY
jgi:hypothetical protein